MKNTKNTTKMTTKTKTKQNETHNAKQIEHEINLKNKKSKKEFKELSSICLKKQTIAAMLMKRILCLDMHFIGVLARVSLESSPKNSF